ERAILQRQFTVEAGGEHLHGRLLDHFAIRFIGYAADDGLLRKRQAGETTVDEHEPVACRQRNDAIRQLLHVHPAPTPVRDRHLALESWFIRHEEAVTHGHLAAFPLYGLGRGEAVARKEEDEVVARAASL